MRIRTLDGLMWAARHRRAVVVTPGYFKMRLPAAFVIGMPANLVYHYIQKGMYLYPRKEK